MIKIVNEYSNYVSEINKLISSSRYKSSYFAEKLELKKPTFYRKLRDNSFSIFEIKIITKILFPKETYMLEFMEDFKISEEDFKNGKTVSNEDYMKQLHSEYDF